MVKYQFEIKIDSLNLTILINESGITWPLPQRDKKDEIRKVEEQAIEFVKKRGGGEEEIGVIKKALIKWEESKTSNPFKRPDS